MLNINASPDSFVYTNPSEDNLKNKAVSSTNDPSNTPDISGSGVQALEESAKKLLSSGNILLALAYIFAVLQVQDQKKLAYTAESLNKTAAANAQQDTYTTMLKSIESMMQQKQSDDKENPKISDTSFKNDKKELGLMNKFLESVNKPTINMDKFNKIDYKTMIQYVADSEKVENQSGAMKSTLQTTVQMQESQFQTTTQFFTSVTSALRSLSNSIAQNIGR